MTSEYCQAEFQEAQRLNKFIITIQVRDRTKLDNQLGAIQYVDMKDGLSAEVMTRLFTAIDRVDVASIRKKRARWKGITPKPGNITDVETGERDDVDTPPLVVPNTRQNQGGGVVAQYIIAAIGAFAVIVAAIITIIPAILSSTNNARATQTALALTPVAQAPTDTATPNSVDATATARFIDEQSTVQAGEMATAFEARIIERLATQITWTPTVDPTLEEPLRFASTPVTSNAQWETVYPNGFVHEFNGVEMVLVPAGCFEMGSNSAYGDERPPHQICFEKAFWIDRFEVSNTQFSRFNTNDTIRQSSQTEGNFPRDRITWYEAVDFCEARQARLPTEAEWEYAARGVGSRIYPWGNGFSGIMVNFCDRNCNRAWNEATYNDGYEYAAPVDALEDGASWVDAYNLSGNVSEWVNTIYAPQEFQYPYVDEDGREDMERRDVRRVIRGGSWFSEADSVRAARRSYDSLLNQSNYTGFRCARSID